LRFLVGSDALEAFFALKLESHYVFDHSDMDFRSVKREVSNICSFGTLGIIGYAVITTVAFVYVLVIGMNRRRHGL